MKKLFSLLTICFLVINIMIVPAYADNHASSIDIDVALRQDGSAHIVQTWYTDTDEGTEFYIYCKDSGYLEYTDFRVSDVNGAYTTIPGEWDIDKSFDEKAGKCGMINHSDGVEMCWGISEYGDNVYNVEYNLHNLVNSYNDMDGFNYRFLENLGVGPTDVSVTIHNEDNTPITDENYDIWAFGYKGQIIFEDGVIKAYTESSINENNNITIMVGIKKGILTPVHNVDESFEDVKAEAFENSEYEDDDAPVGAILAAGFGLLAAVIALVIGSTVKRKKEIKQAMEAADYFRDTPNDGNLNMSYVLGRKFDLCEENSIIGARLLRLIEAGCLAPVDEDVDKKKVRLILVKHPDGSDTYDDKLYDMLEKAAGDDNVLEHKELKKYIRKHYKSMESFLKSSKEDGENAINIHNCYVKRITTRIKDLTPEGRNELDELFGLKKFLLDFSLINERYANEVIIWKDYLIYATMLGIADEVLKQLKTLYPQDIESLNRYENYYYYSYYYNNMMYHSYQSVTSSSGSGGSSSFSGGGGFSGGGSAGSR